MSLRGEQFARIANAEKQLCDEAGPLLAAIIRSIAAQTGLAIVEVRVTFDKLDGGNGSSTGNCTIVRAYGARAPGTQEARSHSSTGDGSLSGGAAEA